LKAHRPAAHLTMIADGRGGAGAERRQDTAGQHADIGRAQLATGVDVGQMGTSRR
jgi:hypothetical protein